MELLEPETGVLRIGHRPERDKRITTHTALVARAFGAKHYYLASVCDWSVMRTIINVEKNWGRGFETVSCGLKPMDYIETWRKTVGGLVAHLTMYGTPINIETIKNMKRKKNAILIIIGAEKTPKEVYLTSDYNIAIGNQPHSEVAALAVFLDRLYNGAWINRVYRNPLIKVKPSEKGKQIEFLRDVGG